MDVLNRLSHPDRPLVPNGPPVIASATFAALIVGMIVSLVFLPMPLVLPVVSTVALALASIVALLAWRQPGANSRLPYWDVTGALAFLGICAALLAEPEQVVPLLEGARRPR